MTSQSTGVLDPDEIKSPVALLLIDVINPLDFPNAEALLKHGLPMSERIAALISAARQQGVPIIYVNDNFGRWRSDFRSQVNACLQPDVLGRPIAELGLPSGCLLVSLQRGLATEVPGRDTVLRAGDRITAAVAPTAAAFLPRLRAGLEEPAEDGAESAP